MQGGLQQAVAPADPQRAFAEDKNSILKYILQVYASLLSLCEAAPTDRRAQWQALQDTCPELRAEGFSISIYGPEHQKVGRRVVLGRGNFTVYECTLDRQQDDQPARKIAAAAKVCFMRFRPGSGGP